MNVIKTIKVIDLLIQISNEEQVPMLVKYKDKTYSYDYEVQDYRESNFEEELLLTELLEGTTTYKALNIELEIPANTKEISEEFYNTLLEKVSKYEQIEEMFNKEPFVDYEKIYEIVVGEEECN